MLYEQEEKARLDPGIHPLQSKEKTKADILGLFRTSMPEIILRTTKLEGEPVTRKMVTSLYR